MKQTEDKTDAKPEERRRRRSFGTPESRLAVPEREGYVRRWVNDTPGRVAMFEESGYTPVLNKDISGSVGSMSKSPTAKVSIHGGVSDSGAPMKMYLMEQKREWYEEDQIAKQKPVDETDKAIREGSLGSQGQMGRAHV